jgi:hypothetical protein
MEGKKCLYFLVGLDVVDLSVTLEPDFFVILISVFFFPVVDFFVPLLIIIFEGSFESAAFTERTLAPTMMPVPTAFAKRRRDREESGFSED